MKQGIHPEYVDCTVKCSCGNTFQTRSTKPELKIDICNVCHPFYTGQQRFVDTGGRVQRFADKFGAAKETVAEREAAKKAARAAAIAEAEAYPGPSLIIGYSPCEMHSIKGGMANCQDEMKKAVDCGYWNLFRFNPAAEPGKKFTLDSKEPAGGYQEFLMNEARYSRLTREFPERASELFERNEKAAMDRYEHLLKLKDVYAEA